VAETPTSVAYKDFAHSPSKLKATIHAVKEQYKEKEVIACMELHTFSSLRADFLPQYAHCMDEADVAYVYYNPKVIEHKRLQEIKPEDVKNAFASEKVKVFTDSELLQDELRNRSYNNSVLLMMSSGNFSGVNIKDFTNELLNK
jgi:UDP-N-acetylmuramate: L-alanyl-gamma-D-glutamyl-meso-diaminopimelate ligase